MCWSRFKTAFRQKIGLVFIFFGLIFFLSAIVLKEYQFSKRNSLSFSQAPQLISVVEEGNLPARVNISKVGIDLAVFPAQVAENSWQVSDEGVSYLLGSGIPGREGNVIIYGHNKNNLFGPIRWLGEEEEIKLFNRKGEEFIYKVVETKIVLPEEVEVLSPTQEPTLTLYTCTGFWDRERFVVVAKLQNEQGVFKIEEQIH